MSTIEDDLDNSVSGLLSPAVFAPEESVEVDCGPGSGSTFAGGGNCLGVLAVSKSRLIKNIPTAAITSVGIPEIRMYLIALLDFGRRDFLVVTSGLGTLQVALGW